MSDKALLLLGHHTNLLFLIGFAIILGTLGARLFQKLKIPQVVGFIAMGVLIGESGFKLLSHDFLAAMNNLNFVSLGVIGFSIGGELRLDIFRAHGREFLILLLAEGLGAFFLVGIGSGAVIYYFTQQAALAIAIGGLLGAISSATAPAATVDVLWEYKSKGLVTTTILALVALDDGLALILFGFASSVAKVVMGTGSFSLIEVFREPLYEIGVALLLGGIIGFMLNRFIRALRDPEKTLDFAFGCILLTCGLSMILHANLILAAMVLGATLANLAPRRSKDAFNVVSRFAPPIYALFFIFVGARMQIGTMTTMGWVLAVVYIVGRSAGKILGVYFGGKLAGSPDKIRRWLGLGLFSQAGVAIGLTILAVQNFDETIGNLILLVVTTTTFVVQLVGPPCVKLAISKTGEIGLNITEEDLIASHTIEQVMVKADHHIHPAATAYEVLELFANTPALAIPVVDEDHRLLGMVRMEEIKETWFTGQLEHLIIAADMMAYPVQSIYPDMLLSEVVELARELSLDVLPVVNSKADNTFLGLIDTRFMHQMLVKELVSRQGAALTENPVIAS
ncbi:MAG: cation:proton antiporter [Candidatus Riflebacteria bacterium]|nr:cation:proton antiporter [Candidatus Riflebacteria bacterium]